MRITNKNNTKPRKEKVYKSESFKDGKFTEEELKQYGLSDDEISTILEYQALLPILQSDRNDSKVNARDLHKQLNNGWKFTDWIENRINSYQLIKEIDYFTVSRKYETVKNSSLQPKETLDYNLTLDCAKQLAIDYVGRYSFNGETWVKYICPEHYYKGIQKVAWYHLKTCVAKYPYCTGRYKTTNDFIKEMQQVNSDIEIIGEYIGSDFPVKCKCKKCKHIWSPIGRSLKYGQGCPVCKNSKGEKQILNFLTKQKIDFEIEKKFEDCKNARMLRFDFYLPTYNLCIEYDGEQHFSPIDFANKGSEWANSSFNQNQKRDEIKNQYCKTIIFKC